jgi:hypothetical protein
MDTHPLWRCQIELLDSEPLIWRTFQVPSDRTLAEFHTLLQLIMGWQNRHSYYFELEGALGGDRSTATVVKHRYGSTELPDIQDPASLTLNQLDLVPGAKFLYMYDLQSGWLHRLTFTGPVPASPTTLCLDGAMACPPEDSGGVWGYEDLLDRLTDVDEPDYEALLNSVGLDFDPDYFKVAEVNQRLQATLPA